MNHIHTFGLLTYIYDHWVMSLRWYYIISKKKLVMISNYKLFRSTCFAICNLIYLVTINFKLFCQKIATLYKQKLKILMYSLYAHGKILHAKYACRLFFRIYISYPWVSYALGKCIQSQGLRLQPEKKATAYTNNVMTKYRLYPCNRKTRKK